MGGERGGEGGEIKVSYSDLLLFIQHIPLLIHVLLLLLFTTADNFDNNEVDNCWWQQLDSKGKVFFLLFALFLKYIFPSIFIFCSLIATQRTSSSPWSTHLGYVRTVRWDLPPWDSETRNWQKSPPQQLQTPATTTNWSIKSPNKQRSHNSQEHWPGNKQDQ